MAKRKTNLKDEFSKEKRQAVRAADELGYPCDLVARIKQANTEAEISRALAAGRERAE